MPDVPSTSQSIAPGEQSQRPPRTRRFSGDSQATGRRAALAKVIPRRARVSWWLGLVLAAGFAAIVTPAITAEHWLLRFHPGTATETGTVTEHHPAPLTVRAPMFAGYDHLRIGGGVVIARGETATRGQATIADAIAGAVPRGPVMYLAFSALSFVLAAMFTHHTRRSTKGRLVRVQLVSLATIAVLAMAVKLVMLSTALSALVMPVAVLALVPTMVLDRVVGLATGVLGALVVSLLVPFDVGLAIVLLVQVATAGLVASERPKQRWLAALGSGLVTTLGTSATYLLLSYLTTAHAPELGDPLHSTWFAAAVGPAIAAVLAVPLVPIYQLLVGEITQARLFTLEDLGHPLLRQIAEKSPGTWQHSLMMANMAEIAANEIGANGRLVRVGAYFHDLGKSLSPTYFIENLEAGETSPHDQLPPEISCDAIFAHVTDGIVHARKAGLHERIIDFMHMHHGDGVLEYFWAKCCEQGNPHNFRIEDFRYPGHPPQSRETAILAICDAVEAASRTLKKPDAAAIDALVQRIVYGKLHLGQLDESGLSMSDLRQINDSLRETIRHANHGRIEYPWQKAEQDASASVISSPAIAPRLDSLDRKPDRDPAAPTLRLPSASPTGSSSDGDAALATTADVNPASEQRIPITANSLLPNPAPRRGAGPARDETDPPDSGSTARGFERGAIPTVAPTPIRQVPATIPGRAPGPLPPPPAMISGPGLGLEPPPAAPTFDPAPPPAALTFDDEPPPAAPTFDDDPPPAVTTFDDEVSPAAIASDKTLPLIAIVPDDAILKPPALGSPPNAQPPRTTGLAGDDRQPRAVATLRGHAGAIAPAMPPMPAMPAMVDRGPRAPDAPPAPPPGGATPAVAVTPPTAAPTSETHLASRLSALLHEDEARVTAARAATTSRRDHAAQVTELRHAAPDPELDARVTEPSMPVLAVGDELRVDLVLPSVPSERAEPERQTTWAHGLAARIDAALSDEWNIETPILAPTRAELRVLLGQPDPTRPQPIDEIAVLQRRAAELGGGDPPRRSPHPTTEVDPDDIEAAIEIAPPARRPTNANAIGAAKPKKPE